MYMWYSLTIGLDVAIVCVASNQTSNPLKFYVYIVKPVLNGRSQKDWKIDFQDQLSLNAGQKYCRMLQEEHSAILLTCIKLPFVIKIFVLSIFEWPFYTGFTVFCVFAVVWLVLCVSCAGLCLWHIFWTNSLAFWSEPTSASNFVCLQRLWRNCMTTNIDNHIGSLKLLCLPLWCCHSHHFHIYHMT